MRIKEKEIKIATVMRKIPWVGMENRSVRAMVVDEINQLKGRS
jgi:hypothetical protein